MGAMGVADRRLERSHMIRIKLDLWRRRSTNKKRRKKKA
jgi:hypothetical protein